MTKKSVIPAVADESAEAAAATAAAAAASAALIPTRTPSQWKKTMGVSDLVVACIFNTSFVFLTLVDWSFDSWCLDSLMRSGGVATASSPEIVALGTYYAWRQDAGPLLKYWNLFVALLLPLIGFTMLSDNFATLRGRRAPLAKHLLDAESLLQLAAVLTVTITKAMPTTEALLALVSGKSAPFAASPLTLVRDLTNIHFLLFGLNALQFFVPFLLWRTSRKQERMMDAEVTAIAAEKNQQEKALEKALAAAEKNATAKSKAAGPSLMEMEARMAASEATVVPDLRKRK